LFVLLARDLFGAPFLLQYAFWNISRGGLNVGRLWFERSVVVLARTSLRGKAGEFKQEQSMAMTKKQNYSQSGTAH